VSLYRSRSLYLYLYLYLCLAVLLYFAAFVTYIVVQQKSICLLDLVAFPSIPSIDSTSKHDSNDDKRFIESAPTLKVLIDVLIGKHVGSTEALSEQYIAHCHSTLSGRDCRIAAFESRTLLVMEIHTRRWSWSC
jgi:hypothetical protein